VEKNANLNPYALSHGGKCATSSLDFYGDGNCFYDSPSIIEINPESQRDSTFSSGSLKLGNRGFKGFFDFACTEPKIVASIAPYPADFSITKGSALYNKYIQPYLTPAQHAGATSVVAKYRLFDVLSALKDGDSCSQRRTSATENV